MAAVAQIHEKALAEKAKKREVRSLKNWALLVSKLVNRERLFREYLP